MNLHSLAAGYIQIVNPSYLGTWLQSTGNAPVGQASFTGSIAATTLTVSAVASGSLAIGAAIISASTLPGTMVAALGTGSGGVGTYTVSASQTVASEAMTSNGDGTRAPSYTTHTNIPMQVQALSASDLRHIDSLNQQDVMRAVYINGFQQGLVRAANMGGDILQIATGITGAAYDTWLVTQVIEQFNASGWTKVAVTLQNPPVSQ